jgi:hypothetical protein
MIKANSLPSSAVWVFGASASGLVFPYIPQPTGITQLHGTPAGSATRNQCHTVEKLHIWVPHTPWATMPKSEPSCACTDSVSRFVTHICICESPDCSSLRIRGNYSFKPEKQACSHYGLLLLERFDVVGQSSLHSAQGTAARCISAVGALWVWLLFCLILRKGHHDSDTYTHQLCACACYPRQRPACPHAVSTVSASMHMIIDEHEGTCTVAGGFCAHGDQLCALGDQLRCFPWPLHAHATHVY